MAGTFSSGSLFTIMAIAELDHTEAMLIAIASAAGQTLLNVRKPPEMAQLVFPEHAGAPGQIHGPNNGAEFDFAGCQAPTPPKPPTPPPTPPKPPTPPVPIHPVVPGHGPDGVP